MGEQRMRELVIDVNEPYEPPYTEVLQGIRNGLREEADHLRALVDNPDSYCPLRDLRRERLRAFEYFDSLLDQLETWEW